MEILVMDMSNFTPREGGVHQGCHGGGGGGTVWVE